MSANKGSGSENKLNLRPKMRLVAQDHELVGLAEKLEFWRKPQNEAILKDTLGISPQRLSILEVLDAVAEENIMVANRSIFERAQIPEKAYYTALSSMVKEKLVEKRTMGKPTFYRITRLGKEVKKTAEEILERVLRDAE